MEQMLSKHEAHTVARQCYNQFVKTYTGLPWATGVMLHTGARIQQIGGDQSPFAPADPSGNGWVGLNPANQGYAVHNTTAGHLVDYFAYGNEQVFQPDVVNTTLWATILRATPYVDPLTNQPDPNALCFSNPAVYFAPRTAPANVAPPSTVSLSASDQKALVKVFPNPANERIEVQIVSEDKEKRFSYTLSNMHGYTAIQEVDKPSVFTISLYGLNPGAYTLLVTDNTGTIVDRIIVFKQ